MPKVSFLISTYNSADYLDRCIRNLMQQTLQDFEIIIVNPNSPDKDGKISERWAEKDDRVKYIYYGYREPYGASWCRAWKTACGEYVINTNTDDLRHPIFAETLVKYVDKAILEGKKIGFAYCGVVVCNKNGVAIGGGERPPFNREVFEREDHAGCSVLWLNKIINEIDYDDMIQRSWQYTSAFDYWLWLKIMSLGYEGLSVPGQLVYYTQRKDSIENSSGSRSTYQSLASIAEFFPDALRRISERENNEYALDFKDWPILPPQEEWVEAFNKKVEWRGSKINILDL